ncbi:MAG: DUF445 family protein [Chitinophagales bacterium]
MMIYFLPVIAAVIGWFTNYLAVKMLFHPKKEKNFILFKLQGIFPKRQKEVAENIGRMVAKELISADDIKDQISGGDSVTYIKNIVEAKVDDYLSNKFPEKYPFTSVLFSAKRKMKIKEDLIAEVENAAPAVLSEYFTNLEDAFDVETIVIEKIEAFPPDKLEEMLNHILKKEFKFIELIGAVIGFLIGLVQILILKL